MEQTLTQMVILRPTAGRSFVAFTLRSPDLRDFVMADNVLHTTLPRPKKPKKPTKGASTHVWQKYECALATHKLSKELYREAAALPARPLKTRRNEDK